MQTANTVFGIQQHTSPKHCRAFRTAQQVPMQMSGEGITLNDKHFDGTTDIYMPHVSTTCFKAYQANAEYQDDGISDNSDVSQDTMSCPTPSLSNLHWRANNKKPLIKNYLGAWLLKRAATTWPSSLRLHRMRRSPGWDLVLSSQLTRRLQIKSCPQRRVANESFDPVQRIETKPKDDPFELKLELWLWVAWTWPLHLGPRECNSIAAVRDVGLCHFHFLAETGKWTAMVQFGIFGVATLRPPSSKGNQILEMSPCIWHHQETRSAFLRRFSLHPWYLVKEYLWFSISTKNMDHACLQMFESQRVDSALTWQDAFLFGQEGQGICWRDFGSCGRGICGWFFGYLFRPLQQRRVA